MAVEWRKYLENLCNCRHFYYVSKIEKFKKCKKLNIFCFSLKYDYEKERNFSHKTSFIIFHTIKILLIIVWNALNEIEMVYRLLDEDFHLLRLFLFL